MKKMYKYLFATLLVVIYPLQSSARSQYPDFTKLVERVKSIVVSISTEISGRQNSIPGPRGSGFIISEDGYILTNRHVVADTELIRVRLLDGREVTARLIGEDDGTDIALIKVSLDDLPAAKIGVVDDLRVGAWVLGFGAPFGFDQTVTAGIVSAKGRALSTEQYVPFIQTDVAINRGNSGGPLVDMKGEVVGINSQILSASGGYIGLSFAIPMDLAMDVVAQLKEYGRVQRGFLGVQYQDVSYELARSFDLDKARGALISGVAEGTPADKAGVKEGDIITQVNGEDIEKSADLPFLIGRLRPGSKAKLKLIRNGKTKQLTLIVGEREPTRVSETIPTEPPDNNRLGLVVANLNEDVRQSSGVDSGVVVQQLFSAGPASQAGLKEGDIIQSLDRQVVANLDDYQRIVANLPENGHIAILITRPNSGSRFFVMKLE